MTVAYEDFAKIEFRSGTVIKSEVNEKARIPALKVWVDFGQDLGVLQTSAQITHHYSPEAIVGKKVVGCVNLGTKNIAGFESQFLLVGFSDVNKAIRLITFDGEVQNGEKLH